MKTSQHAEGARLEDFIYGELRSKGHKVYRQTVYNHRFRLPKEIKSKIQDKEIRDFLESYPFDMFLCDDNEVVILEIKSKRLKFSKDDRKIDVSKKQFLTFEKAVRKGLRIKVLVLWHDTREYIYKIFDFNKLSVIGKKKFKLKIPQIAYSPLKLKYKRFPKKLINKWKTTLNDAGP